MVASLGLWAVRQDISIIISVISLLALPRHASGIVKPVRQHEESNLSEACAGRLQA